MKSSKKAYRSKSSILQYFGLKSEDYWHIDYEPYLSSYNGKNYFWDISKKASLFDGKKDSSGICLYSGVDGKEYYNVIELAQYALGSYEIFLAKADEYWFREFINHCDWLTQNLTKFKHCDGIWINHYPVPLFRIDYKWSSSLTQAFGISTLVRAYNQTKKDKYFHAAQEAAIGFTISIHDGGVLSQQGDFLCLEEYMTTKYSSVLNGYISAIWSIFDLMQIDDNYRSLYQTHIENLVKYIHKWDAGYWSWYDLWSEHEFVASYFYHNLHIKQLNILYKLTGNKVFQQYSDIWEKKRNNIYYRMKAFMKKIQVRLK